MPRARREVRASEVARRLKVDPFKYLVEQFNAAEDGAPEKQELAMVILPYCYPKLRATTHSVDPASKIALEIVIGGED